MAGVFAERIDWDFRDLDQTGNRDGIQSPTVTEIKIGRPQAEVPGVNGPGR